MNAVSLSDRGANYKKDRIYGIEIARIVSMYMIVLLHCLGKGGILYNVEVNTANYFIANFIENLCFGAVNIYALISGYVCLYSKNKLKRILNLWIEVIIYAILITLTFVILPQYKLGNGEMIIPCFPVMSGEYWYFSSYICVFFAMPILNTAVLKLDKQVLFKILIVGFILFSIVPFCSNIIGGDFFKLSQGYSPIWLMYLYLCGAYLRLYGINNHNKYKYLLYSLLAYLINFFGLIFVGYISEYYAIINKFNFLIYNSPFIVVGSFYLFVFFTQININNKINKLVLNVSSVTFFVYIISTHQLVFEYIQKNMIKDYSDSNSFLLIIAVFLSSLIVYISCTIISLIFKKIFVIVKLKHFSDYLAGKLYGLYSWIYKILKL